MPEDYFIFGCKEEESQRGRIESEKQEFSHSPIKLQITATPTCFLMTYEINQT
jgi:hypothetical protein